MKKLLIGLLAVGLLVGCSSKSDNNQNKESKVVKEEKKDVTKQETDQTDVNQEESKYPFPSNATPIGEAKLTLSTPAGDSSDGNTPVLFVQPDDSLIQIGADYENFQGDKQTFIYVDKTFDTAEQIGEMTQSSVNLSENRLKPGVHTVTAVQFENDDPAGNVINFVEAKYEVKEGK